MHRDIKRCRPSLLTHPPPVLAPAQPRSLTPFATAAGEQVGVDSNRAAAADRGLLRYRRRHCQFQPIVQGALFRPSAERAHRGAKRAHIRPFFDLPPPSTQNKWSFGGLHAFFAEHCSSEERSLFFGSTLPFMIDLVLSTKVRELARPSLRTARPRPAHACGSCQRHDPNSTLNVLPPDRRYARSRSSSWRSSRRRWSCSARGR
jgi:hypothetical protein